MANSTDPSAISPKVAAPAAAGAVVAAVVAVAAVFGAEVAVSTEGVALIAAALTLLQGAVGYFKRDPARG